MFGCLCFFKVQIAAKLVGKLPYRWQRGVYLGFSEEKSGYIVGYYAYDKNNRLTWCDHTTQDIKFREDILIHCIDDLIPGKDTLTIRYDKLDNLQLSLNKFGEREGAVPRPGQTANLDQTGERVSTLHEQLWVESLAADRGSLTDTRNLSVIEEEFLNSNSDPVV